MAVKMPPSTVRIDPQLEENTRAFIEGRKPSPAPAPAKAPQPVVEAVTAHSTVKPVVNMRMDPDLLRRIDRDAKRVGISRSAWIHVAAYEKLGVKP